MKDEVEKLRQRTKKFAIRIVTLYSRLPETRLARTLGYQVLRSGTSPGAQYREACRARSDAEIVSKLESVLQELDETNYWLELLVECNVVREKLLAPLLRETDELTWMIVTAVKRIKSRMRRR
jgi:four helix bundle protein